MNHISAKIEQLLALQETLCKMRELIREMVHYRNEHADDAHLDSKTVSDFESKY